MIVTEKKKIKMSFTLGVATSKSIKLLKIIANNNAHREHIWNQIILLT